MASARARLVQLRGSSHAPRTIAAYADDWKDFSGWCAANARTPLPAEPETVALYLSHLSHIRKVSTLERRAAAIAYRHEFHGFRSPNTLVVREAIAGARRENVQRVRQKAAITVTELTAMSKLLTSEETLRSTRDRALLLLGFAGSFRRSELAGLDLEDLTMHDDRVNVNLARSKTDQLGRGRELVIPRAKRAGVCPVRALHAWIVERGHWSGPLFVDITKRDALTRDRIEPNVVYYAMRASAKRAGLDWRKFGAHSLRAGAITAAADAGADVFEIMALSGHKSVENVAKYVRRSIARYPLRKVL